MSVAPVMLMAHELSDRHTWTSPRGGNLCATVATGSLALPGQSDFQSEWPHLHLRQVVVCHLAAHKPRANRWNLRRVTHTQHDCRKGLIELANVGLHVCGPWAEYRVFSWGQAHPVTNWRHKTCEDPHKSATKKAPKHLYYCFICMARCQTSLLRSCGCRQWWAFDVQYIT